MVQAEGEARDLDRRLAAHAEHLGDISAERGSKSTRRTRGRVTDEAPSYLVPHDDDDEPRFTPLAAAMAATATVPPPPYAEEDRAVARRARAAARRSADADRRDRAPAVAAADRGGRVLAGLTTGDLGFGPALAPGGTARRARRTGGSRRDQAAGSARQDLRTERDDRGLHERKAKVRDGQVARGLRSIRSVMFDHGDAR